MKTPLPTKIKLVIHDGWLILLHDDFRKALSSQGNSNCVEWRFLVRGVEVRNSRFPDGPTILYTWDEWIAFTGAVKRGEADLTRTLITDGPWTSARAN